MSHIVVLLLSLGTILAVIASWITHVVVCIQTMTGASIALLFAGILIPPIGWVHGIGSWFGWF